MKLQNWFNNPIFIFLAVLIFCSAGFGQDRYVNLINQPFSNPILAQTETLKETERLTPEITAAFQELGQNEQALLRQKSEIAAIGYTVGEFFEEVQKLHAENREADLQAFIQSGNNKVLPLFAEYEIFIRNYLDATMALVYHTLREDIALAPDSIRKKKEFRKAYNSIEKSRTQYLENRHQYGEAKDFLRTTPFSNFFVKTKALYDTYFLPQPTLNSKLRAQAQTLKKFPQTLGLIPDVVSAYRAIFGGQTATAQHNPVSASVGRIVKKIGTIQGIDVVVEGAENLPNESRLDEVNLFIASHRDGFLDQLTIAHLGLKDIVFFAAVNNFVPNALNTFFGLKDKAIQSFNENNGLIVVGKGANPAPIDKALKILSTSSVRSFWIFPEGRLTEGLGATAGIREKFFSDEGLIAALERAGYKVNLIPISMRDNAKLFKSGSLTSDKSVSIRVHAKIDDSTRRVFMKYGGQTGLAMLLQYGLIDDLVTNERLMWGQVRPSQTHNILLKEYLNRDLIPFCRDVVR